MLGDHSDWGKSKPWEGSAHVPLVCSGPSALVRRQMVRYPVTTMDLAATWLDFAGVPLTSSGMTAVMMIEWCDFFGGGGGKVVFIDYICEWDREPSAQSNRFIHSAHSTG